MTILSQENPVILLLENMLEALSTAPDNINNERRRRRYLLNWLDTARQMREFRGMAEEFTTLRKLLATNSDIPVANTLKSLLESGNNAALYDLYRFRSALAACRSLGWQIGTCAWSDQLLSETLSRAQTGKRHILQLNSTRDTFSTTGRMLRPVAFSLIHPASLESSEVEEIFRDEGFILAHGRECSLNGSGRNMLSRILHVGHSGLPEEEWGVENRSLLLH
ncbi:traC [Escherichia coli]|uniref:traC n=1 Tax=Escherichia coli TaxID=562 RepID=UPI000B4954F4|nr:traC [Escherichia coli]ATY22239.1 traC [Escherichia coli]EET5484419.1 traC [Escherichia coli]EET6534689.1 traC [Escherichia coli]EET7120156.1 traC [Escherichia coli]EET7263227.1 traC [Escherichia coli]